MPTSKDVGDRGPRWAVAVDRLGDTMKALASRAWNGLVERERSRPRRDTRATRFRARHPFYGPVLWGLAISYFVAQVYVSLAWEPSYSWVNDSISDLGITSCDPRTACSPRHGWMNLALFALGAVMAAGSWFIFQEFVGKQPGERLAARIGFACLSLGGAGVVVVSLFPENTVQLLHAVGAAFGIGVGTLGIWILGFGIAGSLHRPLAMAMRIFPPLAIAAAALFAVKADAFIGHGAMERLGAYPETVWLIVFGAYIAQTHYHRARAAPGP